MCDVQPMEIQHLKGVGPVESIGLMPLSGPTTHSSASCEKAALAQL